MNENEILQRLKDCPHQCPDECFPSGTKFGEWRLTALLARGGTAEVHCAKHEKLGIFAAVKILADPLTESRVARFRQEAKLLSEMQSRHFPVFHEYGERNGRPYLVEELLEPRDLPCRDRACAKYLLSVCSGLEELHSRGVVHRDLKPDNVLFRTNGEPVIVDLGIAKIQSTGNPHGEITVVEGKSVGVGTVGYAAPEQFSGGVITPAADIHALGVLAERLISGASSGIYDNWAWRRIIRRATSSIPSERYQTVREFASAIRRRHGVRYSLYGLCAAVVFAALFWSVAELLASGGRFMGRTSMDIEPKVARFWQMDTDHVGYSYMPSVIELGDMTRVMDRQMRIKAGHVCKVIGPGVLDAQIVGPDSATLWMTNCVVLNRAKRIYPDVGLKYELAGGAYLNFTKVGRPDGVNETNYVTGISGWCNDLRYRGSETRVDLMSLKNLEWFQSQVR